MPIDIRQGQAFVQAHGTPLERARLAALLKEARPTVVPPELQVLQNDDGGFPYQLESGRPSTLHHTALALEWLDDFGLGDDPVTGGARAFIRAHQTPGGIWRENRILHADELPLWMDPDSTAA